MTDRLEVGYSGLRWQCPWFVCGMLAERDAEICNNGDRLSVVTHQTVLSGETTVQESGSRAVPWSVHVGYYMSYASTLQCGELDSHCSYMQYLNEHKPHSSTVMSITQCHCYCQCQAYYSSTALQGTAPHRWRTVIHRFVQRRSRSPTYYINRPVPSSSASSLSCTRSREPEIVISQNLSHLLCRLLRGLLPLLTHESRPCLRCSVGSPRDWSVCS